MHNAVIHVCRFDVIYYTIYMYWRPRYIPMFFFLFLETELYGKTLHLQKASVIMLKTAIMTYMYNAIYILFNPFLDKIQVLGYYANSADPDQTVHWQRLSRVYTIYLQTFL